MDESTSSRNAAVEPGEVRVQLDRILSSKGLSSSASLSKFLRHIVQETLEGRQDGLKEFNLGIEIFARGSAFDPRLDPIVRVQARNLRMKLERYYADAGANDAVRIELPKGCYVPSFSYRMEPQVGADALVAMEAPVEVLPARIEEETLAPPPPVTLAPPPHLHWQIPGWVVATLCLVMLLAAGLFYQRHRNGMSASASGSADRATVPEAGSEARSLYLRGRYLLDRQTEDALQKSLACFRSAVAIEPNYAAAWAGLADAYDVMSQLGFMAPVDGMAEARRAANKALSLDPSLAEAHVAMAAILEAYDWNWKGAEREYKRAIELNPALAGARAWYGMFLRDRGRLAEAIPELELAYRLDPVSVVAIFNLANAYAMKGDVQAAIRHTQICAELEPLSPKPMLMLAHLYRKSKRDDLAQQSFDRARELGRTNPHNLSRIASVYARTGQTAEAHKVLQELRSLSRERYVSPYDIAMVYMALREFDQAVPYLESAYRERSTGLIFLREAKNSDAYRVSRRFRELVSRWRLNG